MDNNNGEAFNQLAGYYDEGIVGMPRDRLKASELYLKAGELGCAEGYYNLAVFYKYGLGIAVNEEKARYYWELAAMMGDLDARHSLGCEEGQAGNHHRAMKHFILAAKAGFKISLDQVKKGFMNGFVTKDDYANTLRAYQKRQDDIKSDARGKAKKFLSILNLAAKRS